MKNSPSESNGMPNTPLASQTEKFHDNGNPSALPNVKESRHTGVKPDGTAFLRSKQ